MIQIFQLQFVFVFHLGQKMQLPAPVWKDVMSPAASTLADADSVGSEEKSPPPPRPAYAPPVGVGDSAPCLPKPNEPRYVTPPRPTPSVKPEHDKEELERSGSTLSTAPTELYRKPGDSDTSTPAARRLSLTPGSGDSELGGQEHDPVPGKIRISQQALDARMRRLMKPTAYGTSKVPEELIAMWKKRGLRESP